jgi:serine/threonine protein kinase
MRDLGGDVGMKFCKSCGNRLNDHAQCESCNISDETVILTNEELSPNKSLEETVLLSNVEESTSTNQLFDQKESSLLFNRYQIEAILGKGGMGTVYLVKDLRLNGKLWAIKETMMSPDDYLKFVDEAKMLVDLEHPNLPNIVDYYPPNENGQTYIVMDYIKGKPLSTLFEESGYLLPYQRVIKYAIQLCNLLDYLHHHKPTPIIYRDLKPANVMIDEKDNVQLIDFGIARKYKEGKNSDTVPMGTIGFAAPEQFEQAQTDHRTDLFSLGAMLYYLLSGGRYVYSTGQPLHTINHEVPERLSEIVQMLVKVDPNERYQNTKLLKQDLMKLRITGTLQPADNKTVSGKAKKTKKHTAKKGPELDSKVTPLRRKLKVWTYILFTIILLGLISFGGYKYLEITNDQEHTIEKFENAIIDQDKTALAQLFLSSDERLEIGAEEVGYFLEYLEKNPSELKPLLLSIKEPKLEEPSVYPFLLKKGPKKLFFIETYKVEVQPQFLTIQSNKENSTFLIKDKEISRIDTDLSSNIGPLMPGLYDIEGVWETEFASLKEVKTAELFKVADQQEVLSYEFTEISINIDSNIQEAKLFVNNKDSGKTIQNVNPFGPILTDGTMKVYAEYSYPWGTVRSEEISIVSQDSLQLTLNPLTDTLKQMLETIGNEYANSYVDAYQSGDVNQLKHLDTRLLDMANNEILNNQNNQITWQGTLLSTKYEKDSYELRDAGNNEYEVSVNTSFQYHLAITNPDNPAAEPSIQEINQRITFTYHPTREQWLISDLGSSHSLNGSNIQEYHFADVNE